MRRIILYFDPVNEIWDVDALRAGSIKESNALEEQMGERGAGPDGKLPFQKILMTLISIMWRMAQCDADGSVDEERRDTIIRGLHNITYQLWHWEPERFVEELKVCLADITEKQKRIHFWIDEAAAHVRTVDKNIHGGLPQASSRDVIALAVIMAMLVPEERQPLAMQSIALLMGQLFGWDPRRALEEINICLATWKQDGYRLNAWKDEQGLVHVYLPKKMTD